MKHLVTLLLVALVGCGPFELNMNQETKVNNEADNHSDDEVSGTGCGFTYAYSSSDRSGINIGTITGSDSGSFEGTCPDTSPTGGTFTDGRGIDPCTGTTGFHTITFSLECGYSEDVEFDS